MLRLQRIRNLKLTSTVAAAILLTGASSALAATATFVTTANGRSVSGIRNGNPQSLGFAGTFNIQIDGVPPTREAYCVDIGNPIAPGDTVPQAPVDYPGQVLFILNNAFPQSNTIGTPLPAANDEAAAVQCAIWNYTDNMVCDTPANVGARAAELVAAANAAPPQSLGIIPQSLTLTPASATNFLPGDTSHAVTATLRDGDGNPLAGFVIDLQIISGPAAGFTDSGPSPALASNYSNATAGTDTIRATTSYSVQTGQKFKLAGKQGIVLAGDPTSGTVIGTATKSWVTPQCGNGVVEGGEQCDDGNQVNTDNCTNACLNKVCGDGFQQPGEQCDDGNQNQNDACKNNCTSNVCGDQIVNPDTEECDDGNQVNNDGCTNACQSPECGDSIVQTGEQCDDGNQVNTDACTNACNGAVCGDGITGPGETCDDGNQVNTDGCNNACQVGYCGDGAVQPGEQCDDGNNLNGDGCSATCQHGEICANQQDDDGDDQVDCDDSECGCLITVHACGHPCPARISFKPTLPDRLQFQVSVTPTQVIDPANISVGVTLTNANGIIYAASLLPGDLKKQGKLWMFRDNTAVKGSGIRGGLQVVRVRTKDNVKYRFDVKANSALLQQLATLPQMTIQVVVGSDAFQQTATWDQLRNGWKVNLQ